MRGITKFISVLCCALLLIVTGSSLFIPVPVSALGTLDAAKDIINGDQPVVSGITHDITFALPADAQQVTPSDYIFVNLPNFTNVTAPTSSEGIYGTPIFSVSGTVASMTNVAILPGVGVRIYGITATNPQPNTIPSVIISVASDAAGTVIRNRAYTEASYGGTFITASASVTSLQSSINISGYTAPNAFVTITENGSVAGTSVAAANGFFSFPLNGMDAGSHTYSVSSVDQQNSATSETLISLFLTASTLTSVSNVILSPSFSIDKAMLAPGDVLTLSGMGKPSSQINIFTESPLKSYGTTTNANGIWSFPLSGTETASYNPGQYRGYANIQDAGGNQSIASLTRNFVVTSPADLNNPPPACDISHGNLNCDGVVDLTDFSILLYHFNTNHKVADINSDGVVDLTDFSIMMYYFQR